RRVDRLPQRPCAGEFLRRLRLGQLRCARLPSASRALDYPGDGAPAEHVVPVLEEVDLLGPVPRLDRVGEVEAERAAEVGYVFDCLHRYRQTRVCVAAV